QTGVPLDQLNALLEILWMDGLLAKADSGTPETGAGLTLSLAGVRALGDPERLARLRSGRALNPDDRGAQVREGLRDAPRPTVSLVLVGLNFLVWLAGLVACLPDGQAAGAFFVGFGSANARMMEVIHKSGAVRVPDLVRGEWWRLLTCCFVHFGIIHLGMNMQ